MISLLKIAISGHTQFSDFEMLEQTTKSWLPPAASKKPLTKAQGEVAARTDQIAVAICHWLVFANKPGAKVSR